MRIKAGFPTSFHSVMFISSFNINFCIFHKKRSHDNNILPHPACAAAVISHDTISTRPSHSGQPERNLREEDYQGHSRQTAKYERDGSSIDVGHSGTFRGHAPHDKQAQAKGRGYPGYFYVDQVSHRKPDIIIAQLSYHGYKDGQGNHHDGDHIHK